MGGAIAWEKLAKRHTPSRYPAGLTSPLKDFKFRLAVDGDRPVKA